MEFTDGSMVIQSVVQVSDCMDVIASSIPIGFFVGIIAILVGLGLSGVMKIIKSI